MRRSSTDVKGSLRRGHGGAQPDGASRVGQGRGRASWSLGRRCLPPRARRTRGNKSGAMAIRSGLRCFTLCRPVVSMPEPPSPRPPPAANPGSPTARTPHQDRSVEVTRYLDGALDLEHTVRRTISVDMRFGVARSEHRLGPIGDACEGRDVGVELYATPPRLHDYASAVSKAVALAERPTAPCEGSALVVRCRRSIGVFRRMPLVPSAHRGWRWHGLGPAVLHVVDARQLSRDGTWGAVRIIADPPPTSSGANPHSRIWLMRPRRASAAGVSRRLPP